MRNTPPGAAPCAAGKQSDDERGQAVASRAATLGARTIPLIFVVTPAAALIWFCLAPIVRDGLFPTSSDLYGSVDIYAFFYQVGLQLRQGYTTGEMPFWNQHTLSGAPFLADPASAVFYPPDVVLFGLLSASNGIRGYIVFHLLCGYAGTYAFLRSLGLRRPASVYAAVSYAFSGYVLFRVLLLPLLAIAGLLPVLFFLAHKTVRSKSTSRRLLYAALLACVIAADILSGFPQGTYYSFLAVSGYMAVFAFDRHRGAIGAALLRYARSLSIWFALPMVVGTALCAVQLLPTLEFVGLTNRASGYQVGETAGGLVRADLWAFLGAGAWGEQRTMYAGALALALALLAPVLRPNRSTVYFGVTGVVAILLATQARNPLRDLAAHVLPGWTAFDAHAPARSLVYVMFCLAVLAAWTLDRPLPVLRWLPLLATIEVCGVLLLANAQADPGQQLLMTTLHLPIAILALTGLVAVLWRTPLLRTEAHLLAVPSLLVILAVDLALHYQSLGLTYRSLAGIFGQSETANFLVQQAPPSRYLSLTRPGDWNRGYLDPSTAPVLLGDDAATVYGLQEIQGYNPLQLDRYRQFIRAMNGPSEVQYNVALLINPFSPLLRYLNVRFVVSDPTVPLTQQLSGSQVLNVGQPRVSVSTSTPPLQDIVVDSTLTTSENAAQGTPVGAVDVLDADGVATRLTLRAGIDTAEYAYDRPDVNARIKHARPTTIARSWLAGPDFQGHIYRAILSLPRPTVVTQLRFELLDPRVGWNIDQVITDPDAWRAAFTPVYQAPGVQILETKNALPRAYLAYSVDQVADDASALTRLQDAAFDPRRSVVVEEPPDASDANVGAKLLAHGSWSSPDGNLNAATADSALVQLDEANKMRVAVRTQHAAMLVLSENFYPAWSAYVDGRAAHIYRANFMFRGVALPPGDHTVEFRYESRLFDVGLLISCITLAGMVVVIAWRVWYIWRRDRQRTGSTVVEAAPRSL